MKTLNYNYVKYLIFILIGILMIPCYKEEKTPTQIEREKIMEIEALLRDNYQGFQDLTGSVQYQTKAIPLLAYVAVNTR